MADWDSKLRGEMHKAGAAEAAAPSVTPEAQPAETIVESPPPVDAAPATETPAEAAPSVEAPAGSPPPDQPTPASEVPTNSARETLSKRGLKFEDEKTAAEFLRVESDLAARVRAEKAASKAQPAEVAAAPPQPQPVVPPTPTPAVPEPPVPQAPVVADVEVQVKEFVARDPECSGLSDQFDSLFAELQQIGFRDRNGRASGGRLAEIDAKIAKIQGVLQVSPDALKEFGVDAPGIDAMTRADLERVLQGLQLQALGIEREAERKSSAIGAVKSRYDARVGEARQYYGQQLNEKAEADATEARIEQLTGSFLKQWTALVPETLKKHAVPADMQGDIEEALKTAARAHPTAIPAEDLPAFIDKVVKHELAKSDKYHRSKSAEYARIKEADAKRSTPAPTGKDAVAAPANTENGSWDDRARARTRAMRQSARTA